MTSQESAKVSDCMRWDTGSARARRCTADCWCKGNFKLHLNGTQEYKSWFWRNPDVGRAKLHGYDRESMRQWEENMKRGNETARAPAADGDGSPRYSYNTAGDTYGMGASPRMSTGCGPGCGDCACKKIQGYGLNGYNSDPHTYNTYEPDRAQCSCGCHGGHGGGHTHQMQQTIPPTNQPNAPSTFREYGANRPKRDFGYGWTGVGTGYSKNTTTPREGGYTSRAVSRANYQRPRSIYQTTRTTTAREAPPKEVIYEKHIHHHVDGGTTTSSNYAGNTSNNNTGTRTYNSSPRGTYTRGTYNGGTYTGGTTTRTTTTRTTRPSNYEYREVSRKPVPSGGYTSTRTYESRYR